jgi:hypothetical protein
LPGQRERDVAGQVRPDLKLSWLRADQTGATAAQSANDASLWGAGYKQASGMTSEHRMARARLWSRATHDPALPGSAHGKHPIADFFNRWLMELGLTTL